jgi:hypothetical protein
MLRRPTPPRSSKADNWGNDRCFGVSVIDISQKEIVDRSPLNYNGI